MESVEFDRALAIGRVEKDVGETMIPKDLVGTIAVARVDRLVQRFVDAGQEDNEFRVRLAKGGRGGTPQRACFVNDVNNHP